MTTAPPPPAYFAEPRVRLGLHLDELEALALATADYADELEALLDHARSFGCLADHLQVALLRDLRRLAALLSAAAWRTRAGGRPRAGLTLTLAHLFTLHREIVRDHGRIDLRLAIGAVDKAVKSHPMSYLLETR